MSDKPKSAAAAAGEQEPAASAEPQPESTSAVALDDANSDTDVGELEIEVEGVEGSGEAEADPIARLEAELAAASAEKKELHERFLRSAADLENYRKRTRREVADARIDERFKVLREILPVIDNLERALAHAESVEKDQDQTAISDGIRLVLRGFEQALERVEVSAVDALNKPFDPTYHEAVSQQPTAEVDPGVVVTVLQTGYAMGERLLRPALVVVSTPLPDASAVAGEPAMADETADGADSADSGDPGDAEEG